MPALSGSDKAYRQARSGIARAGATRAGYYYVNTVLTINSVNWSTSIQVAPRISEHLNDEPDTASFTLKPGTTIPAIGELISIGLGTSSNLEFAGQILRVKVEREQGLFDTPSIKCECKDWTRLFDRRRVSQTWVNQSATTIATEIVTGYTSGFTTTGIESGMATVPQFVCDREAPSSALRRLVNEAGGGGFYITPDRDVRFFGSAGDVGPSARTNPQTITNTLSTLMAFSRENDGTQQRTYTEVYGKSSVLRLSIEAGTSASDISTYGIPITNGWIFGASSRGLLGNIPFSYTSRTAVLGPPATTCTAAVAIGATSVALTDETSLVGVSWFTVDGENFFAGLVESGGASQISSIPASGWGSILAPFPSGTPVYGVDSLVTVALDQEITERIPAGTNVRVVEIAQSAGAQVALAAIEGGDGIHIHPIDSPNADSDGAAALAQADIDAFSDEDGLPEIEWVTTDLNAKPGTSQVVNITGTDALSTTLIVTDVDVEFPMDGTPPIRTCRASDVRLLQRADVLADIVQRG